MVCLKWRQDCLAVTLEKKVLFEDKVTKKSCIQMLNDQLPKKFIRLCLEIFFAHKSVRNKWLRVIEIQTLSSLGKTFLFKVNCAFVSQDSLLYQGSLMIRRNTFPNGAVISPAANINRRMKFSSISRRIAGAKLSRKCTKEKKSISLLRS